MSNSANGLRVRGRLGGLLRAPIVHFLAAGTIAYFAYAWLVAAPPVPGAAGTIVVDREALLEFMQYRSRAFERDVFDARLDELSASERESLIAEYVREEALYRKALELGLDEDDEILRRRMVQKARFLIEDTVASAAEPTRADLEAFLEAHRADYGEPQAYTFTHVFFDAAARGDAPARAAASGIKRELEDTRAGFNDIARLGDRPRYYRSYVERTRELVVEHLGEAFAAALDEAVPSGTAWRGPLRSPHGWHLVLLAERRPARVPELDEIEPRVADDYARAARGAARTHTVGQLVAGYDVELVGFD